VEALAEGGLVMTPLQRALAKLEGIVNASDDPASLRWMACLCERRVEDLSIAATV
jgi:hypothetical protein